MQYDKVDFKIDFVNMENGYIDCRYSMIYFTRDFKDKSYEIFYDDSIGLLFFMLKLNVLNLIDN